MINGEIGSRRRKPEREERQRKSLEKGNILRKRTDHQPRMRNSKFEIKVRSSCGECSRSADRATDIRDRDPIAYLLDAFIDALVFGRTSTVLSVLGRLTVMAQLNYAAAHCDFLSRVRFSYE